MNENFACSTQLNNIISSSPDMINSMRNSIMLNECESNIKAINKMIIHIEHIEHYKKNGIPMSSELTVLISESTTKMNQLVEKIKKLT